MFEAAPGGFVQALLAVVLKSAAFYLPRVVLELITFAFFGMALVSPLQRALEVRMPRPALGQRACGKAR
jgi:hypothetical protein